MGRPRRTKNGVPCVPSRGGSKRSRRQGRWCLQAPGWRPRTPASPSSVALGAASPSSTARGPRAVPRSRRARQRPSVAGDTGVERRSSGAGAFCGALAAESSRTKGVIAPAVSRGDGRRHWEREREAAKPPPGMLCRCSKLQRRGGLSDLESGPLIPMQRWEWLQVFKSP
jgi:hypothetical protein